MVAVDSCRRGPNIATKTARPAAWNNSTNPIARRTTDTMSAGVIKPPPTAPGAAQETVKCTWPEVTWRSALTALQVRTYLPGFNPGVGTVIVASASLGTGP